MSCVKQKEKRMKSKIEEKKRQYLDDGDFVKNGQFHDRNEGYFRSKRWRFVQISCKMKNDPNDRPDSLRCVKISHYVHLWI